MKDKQKKRKDQEKRARGIRGSNFHRNIFGFLLSVLVIVAINIIGSSFFTRIDLTAENRYTLSDATRGILEELDDVVYFRVYLEGDFPSGFKRLSRSTQETLDEFRAWTDNIEYEFINPSESDDPKVRNDIYRQLSEKGLEPTSLQVRQKDGSEQRIIFPGALLSYKGREIPLQLLQSQAGMAPEQVLNSSIQDLEYNLATAIRRISEGNKLKVAVLKGHREPEDIWIWDALTALSEYYQVERIAINEKVNSLTEREYNKDSTEILFRNKYTAVVIPKPDSSFSERNKFILDQFIMRGGKVLWCLDKTNADMDSLQSSPETVGIPIDINLDDMLFKYGARINPGLLMDIRSMPIPVKTGDIGGQPQFEFYPWYYMPLVSAASNHPIVRNLNMVRTEFVSSIDVIDVPGISATPLLQTSQYSRSVPTPAYITLEILKQEPDQKQFTGGHQTVSLLLEGEFPSLFANRIPPEIANSPEMGFRERSEATSMIIVSDGDVLTNQVSSGTQNPLPLGYDQYTGETFGNRDFLINAMNYLCDESGLIGIRARDITLRMLDRTRINEEKTKWQIINTAIPVLIVLLFGFTGAYLRRRKFGRAGHYQK